MTSHTGPTGDQAHGGPAIYTRNLVALLVLTTITVSAAYVNFGASSTNVVIALTIATIKAILVALFFMHLRWEKRVNAIICLAGFMFLGVFLMFDLLDFSSRRDPTPRNLPVMTDQQNPTPVPPSMNPLLTPPPQPPAPKAPAAEGEHAAGH